MSTEPKFCKDCKHFKAYEIVQTPFGARGGENNCEHPSLREEVFGNQLSIDAARRREPQSWARSSMGCGPRGLEFEAGERTPGVLQAGLDLTKEIMRKVESAEAKVKPLSGAWIEQHIHPQPRAWWEFWK